MKELSLAQLHAIYSVYRDLDKKTKNVSCCTCGRKIIINSFDDCYSVYGHYIDRSIEPKLKYHPLNAFPQCIHCNVYENNTEIKKKYDTYMRYRFGKNIKTDLINSEAKDDNYYKELYTVELLKLSQDFPELLDILVDRTTGELLIDSENKIKNSIEKQFNTFSRNYASDLDHLCLYLNCEYIEYNKL